jgi:glycosyltransferase involved in cell wall biosynthesis
MAFKDFWKEIKSKAVIYHHHYEEYNEHTVRELRDQIYNSTQSITVSNNSYQHISSTKVTMPEIIFNGINNSIFKSSDEKSGEKRRVIDIALYRGFEKRKGFDIGLKAIENLSMKYKLNCCIIQGSKRAKLSCNYPVYSELSDKDLADILRTIKIFIYPSLFEGFGMPPLEAMACGCAVVTTRVGAIPEYASHMIDACIVEPGSASEIEKAIEYLLAHPNEMLHIQTNAVKTARNYTWAKSAQSLIHCLER